jgi:integrase
MAILAECPRCRKKQATKNKACKCGADLDKLKRSKKVRYWIDFKIPGGKVRQEPVGYSIEEARDADGKRRVQKRENRIFDMLPESNMTFKDLSEWYLDRPKVQKLYSYSRYQSALKPFNAKFGNCIVGNIKLADLEDYREGRLEKVVPSTIDVDMSIIKIMVTAAFDNDEVDSRVLRAFRNLKPFLKRGGNARGRTVSVEEYQRLLGAAQGYLKDILIVAYNTGMRPGEIRKLRWSYVDLNSGIITLPPETTKEGKKTNENKTIPINRNVREVLVRLIPVIQPVTSEHNDFVFKRSGKPFSGAGFIKHGFKKTCKKAGLPYGKKTENGIIMHDFRRSVKTNMLYAGIDEVYRNKILGHSLKGMDVHYIKPDVDNLKQAMTRYTDWLDEQIANLDQTLDQTGKRVG